MEDRLDVDGRGALPVQPELGEHLGERHRMTPRPDGHQVGDLAGETAVAMHTSPSLDDRGAQSFAEVEVGEVGQGWRQSLLGPGGPVDVVVDD